MYSPVNGDNVSCVLTSSITCGNGNPATSNTITMNTFKLIDLKVFLEGGFDPGTLSMTTILNDNSVIPLDQPYNTVPWNYAGTETVGSIPTGVVDWVLVELRDAASPAEALPATELAGWPKACFLKSDGSVVDLDGVSKLNIGNPTISNNLFVVIRHRNHIAVMSNTGLVNAAGSYSYDFTTSVDQAYGGSNGFKLINASPAVYGMVSGDADADGEISVLDYSDWATDFGNFGVYLRTDIDLDTEVSVLDYSNWATNFGIVNPIDGSRPHFSFSCQVPR
jgi:hypothetical protein